MVAVFQYMLQEIRGVTYKIETPKGEKSILADGSNMYPTMPSHGGYSTSPQVRREGYYQPNYNTYQPGDPRIQQRAPSDLPPVRRDEYGRPYYGNTVSRSGDGVGYTNYGYNTAQRQANFGRTM